VLVLLGVLITVFAVLNLKSVRVDWIFGSSKAPLIIVVVVSVLIGGALTYLGERRIRRR
jgi:putative membrane protein